MSRPCVVVTGATGRTTMLFPPLQSFSCTVCIRIVWDPFGRLTACSLAYAGQAGVMRSWRATEALVDLAVIRANLRQLAPKDVAVMAMVKADAYGHGLVQVSSAATSAGASWLGVALVEEGMQLRASGVTAPVLVITEFPPGSEHDALAARLTPTVYTRAGVHRLAHAARRFRRRTQVHVKVDTGLSRVGIPPAEAVRFIREIHRSGLRVQGLWTHFAKSEDTHDMTTVVQLDELLRARDAVRSAGFRTEIVHAANSSAIMAWPQTHLDLVRLGIGMYGVPPVPDLPGAGGLRPAMTWRSRVAVARRIARGAGVSYGLTYRLEREATIATVPAGYGDGFPRQMSNRGQVLIGGRRYPIAGAVAMDQFMVDCGDDPVREGDEVVLMGRQGSQEITAFEIAELVGTITDEIVCRVGPRVPRTYVG